MYNLSRFVEAQKDAFDQAKQELLNGRKQGHWMWFIFPQIAGLGQSSMAQYYAIENLDEAKAYRHHPILGNRLIELCEILLHLHQTDAHEIFGSPDDLKLRSCLTLFYLASKSEHSIFANLLDKYFAGRQDTRTLDLLKI